MPEALYSKHPRSLQGLNSALSAISRSTLSTADRISSLQNSTTTFITIANYHAALYLESRKQGGTCSPQNAAVGQLICLLKELLKVTWYNVPIENIHANYFPTG